MLVGPAGWVNDWDLATDTGGRTMAVWDWYLVGGPQTISAAMFTPQSGWGPAVELGSGRGPRIAVDGAENAVVVFVRDFDLWATRFDQSGGWSLPIATGTNASIPQDFDVGMDRNGKATVVWPGGGGVGYDIIAMQFDSTRHVWNATTTVAGEDQWAGEEPGLAHVELAIGPEDDVMAVWQGWDPYQGPMSLWSNTFRVADGKWGNAAQIGYGYFGDFAMDSRGNAFATWVPWPAQPGENVVIRRYDSVAQKWLTPFPTETYHREVAWSPSVVAAPSGDAALVVWIDGFSGEAGTYEVSVVARWFYPDIAPPRNCNHAARGRIRLPSRDSDDCRFNGARSDGRRQRHRRRSGLRRQLRHSVRSVRRSEYYHSHRHRWRR